MPRFTLKAACVAALAFCGVMCAEAGYHLAMTHNGKRVVWFGPASDEAK